MKFNDYIPQWKERKKDYIKISTMSTYMQTIRTHLMPAFAEMEMDDIDNNKVTQFAFSKLDNGISKKTVTDIIIVLKMIIKDCALEGLCKGCVIQVRYPKKYDVIKESIDVFNDNEYIKLLNYCNEHINEKNLGILITALSGMRIGEICALKWKNIDCDSGVIQVRETLQRLAEYDEEEGKSKTYLSTGTGKTEHSNRDIPIFNDLKKVLQPLSKVYNPEHYVLTNAEKPLEPRTYRNYYLRLLDKLNIRRLKFHGLRHSFASRLIAKGIDVKTVSDILGHSKVEITMNLYVHPTNETKKSAIQKAFRGL